MKIVRLLAAAVLAVTTASAAQAATFVTEQGEATVVLHQALTLTAERDLAFGKVVIPAAGTETVMLSAEDTTTVGGTALSSGVQTSARFGVSGTPSALVSVELPATPVILAGPGAATLEVSDFVDNGAGQLALDLAGQGVVFVGGTLNVPSSALPGTYVGNFPLTVDYL